MAIWHARCKVVNNHTRGSFTTMFDRHFFRSQLGQASIASVAAMLLMVAFSTQMHAEPAFAGPAEIGRVELA